MLTFTQLRKLDTTPSDKSISTHCDTTYDCGDWWGHGFILFHEPVPDTITTVPFPADLAYYINLVQANTRQVWPTRITQIGAKALRTTTKLSGHSGPAVWLNTKYLLAAIKRKRAGNAPTFWASDIPGHPLVCKDSTGRLVSIIMPLGWSSEFDCKPDLIPEDTTLPTEAQ